MHTDAALALSPRATHRAGPRRPVSAATLSLLPLAVLLGVLVVALCAVAPRDAVADETRTVVVAPFSGPRGNNLRRETFRAVEDAGQRVPDVDEIEARIAALGLDLARADDRVTLAREFDAHAVLVGAVEDGRKMEVVITAYNGADGTELGQTSFRDKESKIKKLVRKGVWKKLRDAIERGEQPGAAQPVAEKPPEEKRTPPTPVDTAQASEDRAGAEAELEAEVDTGPAVALEPGADGVTQPLEIAVGIRGFNRAFEYNDDLYRSLRPYNLDFGPAFNLDLAWFPGAHLTTGPGQWFGLVGNFHTAFAIDSATTSGEEAFPTSALGWWVALRTRVPFGLHELALDLGYGQESFAIDDAPSQERPLVPNVDYSTVRFGLSGRVGLGWRNALAASFGYLLVLDAGEVQSEEFFPHADVNGLYASLGYSFAIIPELELRATADWSHYWFKLNPQTDDAIFTRHRAVAGGARDDTIGATFSVVYRFFQAP